MMKMRFGLSLVLLAALAASATAQNSTGSRQTSLGNDKIGSSVADAARVSTSSTGCQVEQSRNVRASVFGKSIAIFGEVARLDARRPASRGYSSRTSIRGEIQFDLAGRRIQGASLGRRRTYEYRLPAYGQTIMVGPVPVALGLDFVATGYYELSGSIGASSASVNFTASGGVGLAVQAGPGLSFGGFRVMVGIEGKVLLVNGSITASLTVPASPARVQFAIRATVGGSCSLSIFAQAGPFRGRLGGELKWVFYEKEVLRL